MSELDADLYGDLYGADDLGLDPTTKTAHTEPQGNSLPPQNHSSVPTAEPQVKTEVAAPSRATALASPPAPIASWSEPTSATGQYKASPPTVNIPQQIPTYQESNNDDRGPARGTYHAVAVEERSVRPSEMKDEGSVHCWVAVGGRTV
ncbi:hypothetical protein BJV78DRAFT_1152360 [Lactifluus subvellereus]|nr:hypothetical protein BJV78DRAFT_1152360 [Lactifluus subvellereus]